MSISIKIGYDWGLFLRISIVDSFFVRILLSLFGIKIVNMILNINFLKWPHINRDASNDWWMCIYLWWWLIFVGWTPPNLKLMKRFTSLCIIKSIFIVLSEKWLTLEFMKRRLALTMNLYWVVQNEKKTVKNIFLVINDNELSEAASVTAIKVDD